MRRKPAESADRKYFEASLNQQILKRGLRYLARIGWKLFQHIFNDGKRFETRVKTTLITFFHGIPAIMTVTRHENKQIGGN